MECKHCQDDYKYYECSVCGKSLKNDCCQDCHNELEHKQVPQVANHITNQGWDNLAPRQRQKNNWS